LLQKQYNKDLAACPRSCYACGSVETYVRKNGHAVWYGNKNKNKPTNLFLCAKCYRKETHARRLVFRLLGKRIRIQLKKPPRSGQCQSCGLEIGDSYVNSDGKKARVKQTQIHHIAYHADDPLKDTIELCGSCHSKESYRLGQLTGLVKGWTRTRSRRR
jgi:DNA-directed RNA polymerase subunit M/transcription elongation factor TFIIS